MSRAKLFPMAAVAIALVVSCGPSIRRTYQSDNAFARCFDMDYNPARSADQKQVCWRTWLDDYVYNQPDDKVSYAELRLDELADGVSVPGPPGPEGAFDQRPVPPAPEPEADAAVEPDEEPAGEPPAAAAEPEGDAGVAELPQSSCEATCKRSFVPCSEACAGSGAAGCATACEAGYKSCMRDCFSD